MSKICCIGSGNMGFALMNGVAGKIASCYISFTDADLEKAKDAAAASAARYLHTNAEAAEKGDYIFLAVKPQAMRQVLAEISPVLVKRQNEEGCPVLVSMAAGWTIEKIQSAVGAKIPLARIMPNTPALVGKGMIAASISPEVDNEKKAQLLKLLEGCGSVDVLDEHLMDAVTGLSGSGPAFVFLFIEALADGGVRAGLPRDKALRYAAQTVLGSAAMVQKTGKHPGVLKDMVASPGGTTIAGLSALEDGAFRGTVIRAVEEAWQRSIQLADNII